MSLDSNTPLISQKFLKEKKIYHPVHFDLKTELVCNDTIL